MRTLCSLSIVALLCLEPEKGPLTRQREQNNPIHHQNRPEHGNIKHAEPGAQEADRDGACRGVPEFELREPPHERPELLRLFCGEARAVFHGLVLLKGGVELRGEKREEEVEEVDPEGVGDWCARG